MTGTPELEAAARRLEEAAAGLLRALEAEAAALAEGPAPLEAAVRAKEAAIAEVEAARRALEEAAGAELAALFRAAPSFGPSCEPWARLRALLQRCRERNTLNGGLIASSRRRVEEALALLRATVPASPCYTPDGASPAAGGGGRSLGRV